MRTIIILLVILFLAIPAYADAPPVRPEAWETAAATKVAAQRIRLTATATLQPYPLPTLPPYPEPEAVAWWEWLLRLVME